MLASSGSRRGFTLIEALVAVAIIGVLVGLILPAVQAAREASRRTQCVNNLRQLALGFHNYADLNGVYPMGTPFGYAPELATPYAGHSVFVAILPQIEQSSLYNAINFDRNIYTFSNQTAHQAGIATLWCPSDGIVGRKVVFEGAYLDIPDGKFEIAFASYAASAGTWYHLTSDLGILKRLAAGDNGIAFVNSAVRIADIQDGTSQTLLLGERNHQRLDQARLMRSHWWYDGYSGDTLFWTLHPINPSRVLPASAAGAVPSYALVASLGSSHPGGANVAMADGSVRFLKETVDSWPIGPDGMPIGVTGDQATAYVLAPGTKFGVLQSLSTRGGGEVIPAGWE